MARPSRDNEPQEDTSILWIRLAIVFVAFILIVSVWVLREAYEDALPEFMRIQARPAPTQDVQPTQEPDPTPVAQPTQTPVLDEDQVRNTSDSIIDALSGGL